MPPPAAKNLCPRAYTQRKRRSSIAAELDRGAAAIRRGLPALSTPSACYFRGESLTRFRFVSNPSVMFVPPPRPGMYFRIFGGSGQPTADQQDTQGRLTALLLMFVMLSNRDLPQESTLCRQHAWTPFRNAACSSGNWNRSG